MASIRDIAEYCNVSIATVSNVLNNKPNVGAQTRNRVLLAIQELDYVPNDIARNLKTGSSRTIGVILEDITVFCVPEIIEGISSYCEKLGYHVLLSNLRLYTKYNDFYYQSNDFLKEVKKEILSLTTKQIEGLIYVAAHERKIEQIKKLLDIPSVIAYGYSGTPQIPSIAVDDVQGGYDAANYLISKGHKQIGLIRGKKESVHTKHRLLGFQKALAEAGILYSDSFSADGDWTRAGGYQAARKLPLSELSAVFCMNDPMAAGLYDYLQELSLIPGKDISIIGYDNQSISEYLNPPLTTIALPLLEIGKSACRSLVSIIEGEDKAPSPKKEKINEWELKGKLILRSSVEQI